MALILKDRVKETSATAGTGSLTLTGAVAGYQTFNSVVANGSTVYYTIQNQALGFETEWEVGVGTFTSPSTLSRDTVLSSSAGAPTKTNFSSSPELQVFITQPAEEAVYLNQATGLVEIGGNGTNTVSFNTINTTNLTANTVTLTAGTISTNATSATDITNKQYVDGLFSTGVSYHQPVLVESPTALTATYNQPNGAGNGVGATLTNSGSNVALVIDGVSVSNTARVLVYQQANAVHNGVYTVTNSGAPDSPGPGAAWVLTRATDADTFGLANPNTLGAGDAFFVQSGNTGAGETYVCNTQGTITFGSSNITFAQISSAQIYAAGTGLNLANLTFSIANTAVTAATYGNDGNVAQFTVNAQGQITNASNVAINASSITIGTLDNTRTTANASNGANTIVSRDANGSFTANVVVATDVNATNVTATTGSFTNISGNGASLTNINASNITSGTINNSYTTGNSANSANTLVLRDANGAFAAGNITGATFIGAGDTLTSINASNISSGTIANARTTAASANGASTIVQRDAGGNFSANTITANVSGSGSGLTNINASNITSGTIGNAFTTANSSNGASTIVLRDAGGAFAAGAITGAFFIGDGSNLSAINASNVSTGTLANARTTASSSNGANTIVSRDSNGSFAANTVTATTGSFTSVSGNGVALTAINASNVTSGTLANARTTGTAAATPDTLVLRDANASFSANVGTFTAVSGNGVALTGINASNITSGTVDSARISGSYTGITGVGTLTAGTWNANVIGNVYTTANSANGANTIVSRDANGSFSANVVTATFVGNASTITDINASNITSGTISNARTTASSANGANTIVSRDANGSFSANVVTATSGSFTNVSGNGIALTAINATNVTSGTLDNARTTGTSSNVASTLVLRGSSGEFSAGAITAASFTGSGSGISAINASNVSTGTLSAQYGGTGLSNLTANTVILGNGANAVQLVSPGALGNVLTSNGTTWISQVPSGGGGGTITRTDFTATASQTVFNVSYTVGLIDVYRNGVKLATTDFTATNGTSFTLATPANAGDIIQAEVFSALNLYETITADSFSGNGVATTFTMSVAASGTAATFVSISGVLQDPSTYSISGTTLTFTEAPPSGSNNISVRYLGVPGQSNPSDFPFFKFDGSSSPIAILNNQYLPFFTYTGSTNNINLTAA